VNLYGKEMEIPSMVPGLSRGQVERLVSGKFSPRSNNPEDEAIKRRAISHAIKRLNQGKSPFKN